MSETTTLETEHLARVAAALLKAAIFMRDMSGAVSPSLMIGMPPDLRNRMLSTEYQDCVNSLPGNVRRRARELVEADPDVLAAQAVDAGSTR